MRPTITEQLRAIRRILNDVIAPEVTATYPSDILKNVLVNLKELEDNWVRWTEHLEWENSQLAEALRDARPRVDAARQEQFDAALGLATRDRYDYEGAIAYNEALRAGVVELIRQSRSDRALAGDADRVKNVLKEGIQRRN
jgi:hypothetical protein